MKKLLLILAFGSITFGQQFQQTYGLGSFTTATSAGTFALSATATWFASGWMPTSNQTVSKVRFYAGASTGSPSTSGDVTLSICPDAGGSPGTCPSPLATSSTITSATAPGWIEFTGFSLAMTAYTQYWFVLTNTSSGGTKYFSWRYYTVTAPNMLSSGFTGEQVKTSTASGSPWTSVISGVAPIRVEYSGSVFAGYPFVTMTLNAVTNQKLYGSHIWGPTFTMPPNVSMNMKGCGFAYLEVGTPTGSLECQVWTDNGTTAALAATSTLVLSAAQVDTTLRYGEFYFATPVVLAAGTTYHVVLVNTAADSSSNYYNANLLTIDSDVHSLALMPFGGTLKGAYCLGTCTTSSNWVTTYDIPLFAIMLDPAGEFNSTGGGGAAVQRISGYVK